MVSDCLYTALLRQATAAPPSDGACGFCTATALNLSGAVVHFAVGIEMVRLWKRENLCLSVRLYDGALASSVTIVRWKQCAKSHRIQRGTGG